MRNQPYYPAESIYVQHPRRPREIWKVLHNLEDMTFWIPMSRGAINGPQVWWWKQFNKPHYPRRLHIMGLPASLVDL